MRRAWVPMLFCLMLWKGPVFGGEISWIQVEERTAEKAVIGIHGDCRSYRVFGSTEPARLIIDFEAARAGRALPETISLDGCPVANIEVTPVEMGLRVLLVSAQPNRLFKFEITEETNRLKVLCAGSGGAAVETASSEQTPPLRQPPERDVDANASPGRAGSCNKEKMTLDFFKTDLHNVFRVFSEVSGKNIIVDEGVKGELSLSLKEVPWDLAMEVILEANGLIKDEMENIFIIRPEPEEKEGGEGILVVRGVADGSLDAFHRLKQERDRRQDVLSLVVEARNAERNERIDQALLSYQRAFLLMKENSTILKENIHVLKRMAYLYSSLGNAAKGRYFAAEALKLDPEDVRMALYAAVASAKLGDSEEARLFFDIAARNGHLLVPEAFYDYGVFLEEAGELAAALSWFHKYEDLFGPSTESSLAIARSCEALGNVSEACRKYREISQGEGPADKRESDFVRRKLETLCRHQRGLK